MKRLLCYIGIHDWHRTHSLFAHWTQVLECSRCGKRVDV